MAANGTPSEVSPLLGDHESTTTLPADTSTDIERRGSAEQSKDAQPEGLPEVQKKFRYILPAISIGVCLPLLN